MIEMTLPKFFFFYNAIAITLLSVLIVTRKSPVHSVLMMLVMFFHVAGLYLFLNAEFIAALQIIVYAGAILVLFLFVVFLLNVTAETAELRYSSHWPTALTVALFIFVILVVSTRGMEPGAQGGYSIEVIEKMTHVKAIGTVLYTEYLFPFEVASLVLLVAMIGAITLSKKKLKS